MNERNYKQIISAFFLKKKKKKGILREDISDYSVLLSEKVVELWL